MQIRHKANVGERILRVKIFNSTAGPSSTSRRTQPFTTWTYARKKFKFPYIVIWNSRNHYIIYIIVYDVRNKSIIYIVAAVGTHYSW